MLDIKVFDTSSYQELLEDMRNELIKKSDVTFYDSDMEIVILELWALLIDMQNYMMDVNSERMEKEMLRFLLGDLHKRKSAKGILFAKNTASKWIVKHTLFEQVANIPFEVSKNTYIQDNDIMKCTFIKNDQPISWRKDIVLEKGMEIEITLRKAMEMDHPFVLFFEIENERVTPIPAYQQATISCFYESNHGTCTLAFEDETLGFLTSGRLLVFPHKQHCECEGKGWNIHIKIEEACYDQSPRFHDITLNPLEISQQETYATSLIFPLQPVLFVQDALAYDGVIYAYVYQNQCYKNITSKKDVQDEGVYIHIPTDEVGDHVLLILQRREVSVVGSTNGISTQQITIPYQDIEYVRLLIKQIDGWHDVSVFAMNTYQKERPYGAWYDSREGILQFGQGNDFLIPEKGFENIMYRDLVLTKGKQENIKEQILTSTHFEQRYPTHDGDDEESISLAKTRVLGIASQSSSLNVKDIQKIAQKFPGNALTYTTCVPKKYLSKHNGKGYAVMLGSTNKLSNHYLAMMTQWLTKQLPFGVQVELMQAKERPISIHLQTTFVPNEKEEIQQCIETWMKQRKIGEVVRSIDLIQYLVTHTPINEVQECCFYDHHYQSVDQFKIAYDEFVVINEINISAKS